MPAGTKIPDISLRPNPAVMGKSAPAAFGTRSKLAGAPEPWQRGRTPNPKSPSPRKAAGRSSGRHAVSPLSDTSSGLGTPVESDSEGSSSSLEEVPQLPAQSTARRVSFKENSRQNRLGCMESPFDAAAQIAHPRSAASKGQGPLGKDAAPQTIMPRPTTTVRLPRADVLVIGGDLAYPNPSNETYEQRFFRPFEAALPPPPHVRPGRLVVYKPDLPGAADLRHASSSHATAETSSGNGVPQNPSRYVYPCVSEAFWRNVTVEKCDCYRNVSRCRGVGACTDH